MSDDSFEVAPSLEKAAFLIFSEVKIQSKKRQNPENKIAKICNSIETLLEEGKKQALLMMQKLERGCMPTYILYSKAGEGNIFPIFLDALPQTRETQIALCGPLITVINASPMDGYVFVFESWKGRMEHGNDFVPPSKQLDRTEVLMVHAYLPNKTEIRIYDIIRGKNKEDIELKLCNMDSNCSVVNNPCLENLFAESLMKKIKTVH
jgi:hypothetical protein